MKNEIRINLINLSVEGFYKLEKMKSLRKHLEDVNDEVGLDLLADIIERDINMAEIINNISDIINQEEAEDK